MMRETSRIPAVLIRGGAVFAPEPLGTVDILTVGERVAAMGPNLSVPSWAEGLVLDAHGRIVVPGLIDQHVHIAGGGGEGGPQNRTPEIPLTHLTTAGITTVVGVLGTDASTRHVQGLLAKARQLMAEGLTAWIYTGAYEVPTRTITENARTDLILIDRVLGIGEIAVNDQRGTHPTVAQLAELFGEARVGGLLGGKAGVLHLHVGSGPRGLRDLFRLVDLADVPREGLVPTHLNRSASLLGDAARWGRDGGLVDLTTDIRPTPADPGALSAHEAALALRREGIPWDHISFSSDGQGSAPTFDDAGHLIGVGIGRTATLLEEVGALAADGLPWEEALCPATTTPARILHLPSGRLAVGRPADVVLLRESQLDAVLARGRLMVRDGKPVVRGRFEEPCG